MTNVKISNGEVASFELKAIEGKQVWQYGKKFGVILSFSDSEVTMVDERGTINSYPLEDYTIHDIKKLDDYQMTDKVVKNIETIEDSILTQKRDLKKAKDFLYEWKSNMSFSNKIKQFFGAKFKTEE